MLLYQTKFKFTIIDKRGFTRGTPEDLVRFLHADGRFPCQRLSMCPREGPRGRTRRIGMPGESGCTAARKPPDVVANGGSLKPSLPAAVRTGMHTAVNEGE